MVGVVYICFRLLSWGRFKGQLVLPVNGISSGTDNVGGVAGFVAAGIIYATRLRRAI